MLCMLTTVLVICIRNLEIEQYTLKTIYSEWIDVFSEGKYEVFIKNCKSNEGSKVKGQIKAYIYLSEIQK